MKRVPIMKSFHLLTMIILVAGCSQNKGANTLIYPDYALNDTLSRKDLLINIPIQKQIKLSKQLSPDIQSQLWLTKINDTLDSQALTEDEKGEIETLIPFLSPDYFAEKNDILSTKCEDLNHAMTTKYGWSEEKVFLYLGNFYTQKEYDIIVKGLPSKKRQK